MQTSGTVNVEAGYAFNGNVFRDSDRHDIGQVLVRLGVVDNLELRAGLGSIGVQTDVGPNVDNTGYLGLSLGTKIGLMSTERSTVSFLTTTGIPATATGIFEAGDPTAVQEVKLAIDNALNETVTLSVNGGIQYRWKAPIGEQAVFIPTLSFAVADNASMYTGYAYIGGENFVEGGLTILPASNTQLDVNFGIQIDERSQLSDDVDYYFLGFGIAQRF